MRKYFRSIGLIRKMNDPGQSFWLAVWSDDDRQFGLVSAPRLESESFREAIMREVGWELDLNPNRDFLVSSVSQLNLEFVGPLPNQCGDLHVAVAFYLVDLFKRTTKQQVESDERCRWLTSQEVVGGLTSDGHAIDETQVYLINRAQVINAWD